MIDQLIIRPAKLSELNLLLEYEQAMIASERPFDETIRTDENVHYYDLEELINSPDAEVLVAELDSKIIGTGYARIEAAEPYLQHETHSYLGFMYVVPEHRGKGINKKIIEKLEAWTMSKGVTEMQLEVYAGNAAAVRAYEKSGYDSLLVTMRKSLV